jgi:PA14 domain
LTFLAAVGILLRVRGRAAAVVLCLLCAPAARADEPGVFGSTSWLSHALRGQVYLLPPGTGRLPDTASLSPVGTLYATRLDIPNRDWQAGFPGISDRFEWFAIEYTGRIRANRAGRYGLRISSDDGSRVYVDGRLVVDNDGVHPESSASGFVDLDEAEHELRVQYFQGPRYQIALRLFCTPPGGSERLFPDCDLALDTPGHRLWPWLLLPLFLLLGALTLRRRKARLRILTPGDLTIQLCGRDLTLTAETIPPGREAEIEWEVPLDQSQSARSGRGRSFTLSFGDTGVKQVIARLGGAADDLILYLFKTGSGAGTVADLLEVRAPAAGRSERDYRWYRAHAIPPEDVES